KVEEEIRDAQRDIEVNRWWRRFALALSLISTGLVVGAFSYSAYAELVDEKIWQLVAATCASLVVLAVWTIYLVILIKRLKRERELYRKIFRCRASRKNLISRMAQSEDL